MKNTPCRKEKLVKPVVFEGYTVITTELLAQVYETSVDNIKVNFSRNKEKFEEGKHYILLQGDDLKEFKSQVTESYLPIEVSKFTSQLYLWTERGANRHCKILDTDKAWEQFSYLEETYFTVREQPIVNIDNVDLEQQISEICYKAQAAKEISEKVEDKLNKYMTINSSQQKKIKDAVSKKVFERLLVCKEFDIRFNTEHHKAKFYGSLYSSLKRKFRVSTYRDILFVDYEKAIKYIREWTEPLELRE